MDSFFSRNLQIQTLPSCLLVEQTHLNRRLVGAGTKRFSPTSCHEEADRPFRHYLRLCGACAFATVARGAVSHSAESGQWTVKRVPFCGLAADALGRVRALPRERRKGILLQSALAGSPVPGLSTRTRRSTQIMDARLLLVLCAFVFDSLIPAAHGHATLRKLPLTRCTLSKCALLTLIIVWQARRTQRWSSRSQQNETTRVLSRQRTHSRASSVTIMRPRPGIDADAACSYRQTSTSNSVGVSGVRVIRGPHPCLAANR